QSGRYRKPNPSDFSPPRLMKSTMYRSEKSNVTLLGANLSPIRFLRLGRTGGIIHDSWAKGAAHSATETFQSALAAPDLRRSKRCRRPSDIVPRPQLKAGTLGFVLRPLLRA